MMNVVFTGPAFDSEGNSVLRADLTYACIVKGNLTVQVYPGRHRCSGRQPYRYRQGDERRQAGDRGAELPGVMPTSCAV